MMSVIFIFIYPKMFPAFIKSTVISFSSVNHLILRSNAY